MYAKAHYNLSELPEKTLCLTFDDGPGQYTYDIAKFLNEHGVRATFFVVGKYAFHHQDILQKLQELGHIVANHTYDHPDIPYYQSVDGDLQNQIIRTDHVIRKYVTGNKVFFRAPYGKWSQESANELNANMLASINHIGPIHWDVAGIDCYYWKLGKSVSETVDKYLEDIAAAGHKGIIVMHDEIADMDIVKPKNQTLELVTQLIPVLLEKNYRFIGLDQVESLQHDLKQDEQFVLRARSSKKCVRLNGTSLAADGGGNDASSEFTMIDLGYGKVALSASNGMLLDASGDIVTVTANSGQVRTEQAFDLVPLRDHKVVFRTYNGNFLHIDRKNGNKLTAAVGFMRQAEIFEFTGKSMPAVQAVSFAKRLRLLKKGFLFVKSKLLNQ